MEIKTGSKEEIGPIQYFILRGMDNYLFDEVCMKGNLNEKIDKLIQSHEESFGFKYPADISIRVPKGQEDGLRNRASGAVYCEGVVDMSFHILSDADLEELRKLSIPVELSYSRVKPDGDHVLSLGQNEVKYYVEHGTLLVAKEDGNIMGVCGVKPSFQDYYPLDSKSYWDRKSIEGVEVGGLFVAKKFRSKGIGKKLLNQTLEISEQKYPNQILFGIVTGTGHPALKTQVRESSKPALEVLKSKGFKLIGYNDYSYGPVLAKDPRK